MSWPKRKPRKVKPPPLTVLHLVQAMSHFSESFAVLDLFMSGDITLTDATDKLRKLLGAPGKDERSISCHHAFNTKRLVEAIKTYREAENFGGTLDFEIERAMGLIRTDCTLSAHEANDAVNFAEIEIAVKLPPPNERWMSWLAQQIAAGLDVQSDLLEQQIALDPSGFADAYKDWMTDRQFSRLKRKQGPLSS